MAIDTAAKRRSAIATRRLPWFRRFIPAPDGSISQADRMQLAFVYGSIQAVIVAGPYTVERQTVYVPGSQRLSVYVPGSQRSEVYVPGSQRETVHW